MAELNNGPLGSIRGKVGNMVAGKWRNISYLRALGTKSNKEPSLAQKEVQMKFNLLTDFLTPIKPVLELGLLNKDTGRATALNLALKENIVAFKGVFPNLELDYPKIVLSTGKLSTISSISSELKPEGKLQISWIPFGSAVIAGAESDQVNVIVYSRTQNLHAYFPNVAVRSDNVAEVEIPKAFLNDELHVYLFLCTEKKDKSSTSVYLPIA